MRNFTIINNLTIFHWHLFICYLIRIGNVKWYCINCSFWPWNNGNRDPRWGVAEIRKMSPPTTVGDAADMQLCVIKQGSPPVLGNVAFFVTDLLTLARWSDSQ